jgi:hypothetical protein
VREQPEAGRQQELPPQAITLSQNTILYQAMG